MKYLEKNHVFIFLAFWAKGKNDEPARRAWEDQWKTCPSILGLHPRTSGQVFTDPPSLCWQVYTNLRISPNIPPHLFLLPYLFVPKWMASPPTWLITVPSGMIGKSDLGQVFYLIHTESVLPNNCDLQKETERKYCLCFISHICRFVISTGRKFRCIWRANASFCDKFVSHRFSTISFFLFTK